MAEPPAVANVDRGPGPALCGLLVLFLTISAAAQPLVPIEYTVRIPSPRTHYVEVEARVPTQGQTQIELMMAVWTQYVIREYARNVEAVTARTAGGQALAIEKVRKNRWRVSTGGADPVIVSYKVYCHEMSTQDNWVDDEFALLNGAATFLTLAEHTRRPHGVTLILPHGWQTAVTGMPDAGDGRPDHFRAADYEALVDSPILAGNPKIHEFTVDGKPHFLADIGEEGVFDGARAARDLSKLVAADARFWGGLPYRRYLFLNILSGNYGGMEHSNSTALMSARSATRTPEGYEHWLELASHEFFHTWNVKRLRPAELIPGEYETEPYTGSLGISEGFSSYYEGLQVRRAGLNTDEQVLTDLSHAIRELQNTPGRLVQSLSMSSFDTWIKFYHPDENSINTSISYYTKGEVAGFLLDARVRSATDGARSLDDVMRLALKQNPEERGFTPREFRAAASEIAGVNLGPWFVRAFDSTAELDYSEALRWYGLRFITESRGDNAWLGAPAKVQDGRLLIADVPRGTPAYDAGLDANDEILGINEFRVRPEQWERELSRHKPGDRVTLKIARRDRILKATVTLGREPDDRWTLEVDPACTPAQTGHRQAWLTGR